MLTLSSKGFRSLLWVLTLSLIIGAIAVIALVVSLVVLAFKGNYLLPLVLSDSLEVSYAIRAGSLGAYLVYALCLVATIALGLYVLFLLRSMVFSLARAKAFTEVLPLQVKKMGFAVFIIAYARQLLLGLVFLQDVGALSRVMSFRFQVFPPMAVYALVLLVLSRIFTYSLELQSEYEQTV